MIGLRSSSTLLILLSLVALCRGDEPKPIARLVHYTGEVQGVGFRAVTAEIAKDHPVTGYVKNLTDGRVQLFVEGEEEAVKKFLTAVRNRWKKNIEKEQTEEKPAAGKYKKFTIER